MDIDPKDLIELKEKVTDQIKAIETERQKMTDGHKEVDQRVAKIQEDLEKQKNATVETRDEFQKQVEVVARLEKDFEAAIEKMEKTVGSLGGPAEVKGYAQQAAECEGLKSYTGGNLTLVDYNGPAFTKDVTSVPGSAGVMIQPYRVPGVVGIPERPLSIRDLLTSISIATNAIEWVRENVLDIQAAPQENEGDAKKVSDITYTLESGTTTTIAHWIPISRQALADIPLLQGMIESKMRYGLLLEEEDELLLGDGTGGKMTGLLPQATAYNGPAVSATVTNVDMIRRAMLQGTRSLYPVDSFVFDPEGWCDIELTKDANNAYMFASPQDQTIPRLWGKRVVESHAMPVKQFIAGGFAMGATLWDREAVTVRISEHHEDFFSRNMVALLVEERVGLTVERAGAFIKGSVA